MCPYLGAFALELDTSKFMPVDEIKLGMKGIGKTVFKGTKIDEFQVVVLDVTSNPYGSMGDIIWVECSGGPLAETGVLGGMSGSPVYIDGRLIGAVAYRSGSFVKRPIAGITPIASMLPILEEGEPNTQQSMLDARYTEAISSLLAYESESSIQHQESSIKNNAADIAPIHVPVVVSGFHSSTIEYITPVFEKLGMIPVQGGGASSRADSVETPLEPGAIVGVQYMRGDASSFGYGTVTYTQGDKVLAFGHPLSGMGEAKLPMACGRVAYLVPSMLASSKIAVPGKTMGTLAYDSQYGVMGVIGKQPEFIPMKVRINAQEYNFEIAENRSYSSVYIFAVVLDVIYSTEKATGDYTMRTHSEIKLKGYPVISNDNFFSGRSPGVVASAFTTPVNAIMRNSFEEVDVESLLLDISFEDKRTNAVIDGVRINKDWVRPGDSVTATIFLTPYMQDTVRQQFEVTIPKDVPEGPMLLRLSDAANTYAWERTRAPMKTQIADLPHLVQIIREEERNDDIIAELYAPKVGVTIGDQELPALPLSTFSVMNSQKQSGGSSFTRGTTFSKQRIRTNYAISGSAMMFLNIDRDAP